MTSRRPYWCPKTMKRRPCWCPKPILWELNSFPIQTLSFVPINLHRSWPREWKRSIDTTFLLDKLDLVVHPEKSTSIPSQVLVILGFTINSLTITIQLTIEKPLGLKTVCVEFLPATTLSIREVASAIGGIVASFHGVMHGPLFFRHLEKDKCLALEEAKGNFDAHVPFTTS